MEFVRVLPERKRKREFVHTVSVATGFLPTRCSGCVSCGQPARKCSIGADEPSGPGGSDRAAEAAAMIGMERSGAKCCAMLSPLSA